MWLMPVGEEEDDPFLEDTGEEILGFPVYTTKESFPWVRRKMSMPVRDVGDVGDVGGFKAKFPTVGELAEENTKLRLQVIELLGRISELQSPEGLNRKHRLEMLERHLSEAEAEIVALRAERDEAREELETLRRCFKWTPQE